MFQLFNSISMLYRAAFRFRRSGLYLLLGITISFLILTNQVQAAETVQLQDRDRRMPISLADLQVFAADQAPSPDLQKFLQDANQDPAEVKQWLTTKITPPQLTQKIPPDFVLLQLNKILGDPSGRESLEPLRTAFAKAEQDNSFSVLEVLENYPKSEMRLEISRLGQTYTDVNLLVTRIEPVLQVAEALLPELVCGCNVTPAAAGSGSSQGAIAYSQTRDALKALLPVNASDSSKPDSSPDNSGLDNSGLDNSLTALEPSSSPALANKSLVFQFGPFGRSIAMTDLTRFAETGEISRGWRFFFNVAGVDAGAVQAALNQEVSVSLRSLDRTLNSLLGEFLLYQVGQIVQTPSNTANIQALRSASVLSATDNRLSLLEILQQYPTRQVHVNGLQLARLGQNATRFQARGGGRAAVISLEDWLVQLQASEAETLCTCDSQAVTPPTAPTISAAQVAQFLPANWQPVAPHREDRGIIKVVWLQGTPYDMGYQHGQYLHDEIATLGSDVLGALRFAGRGLALGQLAAGRSFPDIVEECRGLTAATQDIGMTNDACLVLAYGDVYQEVFANTLPSVLFWEGCSQWVATGEATKDGRLYHGSTLDNDQKPIDYIMNNPVVFVRQPNDGLPHVFITYPGVVWPNWGLNVAGITLGLDSAHPNSSAQLAFQGGSDVQIMGQILKTATSFAEARQIMETQPRVRANLIMMADGKSKEAGVFEVTGSYLGVRELQENGVLYTTNHFALEEMFEKQRFPVSQSSLTRFDRFSQLMEPEGSHSHYGTIDPAVMAKIGRDRVNPHTLEAAPFEVFDDDASPGGNGSLRQGIYDPDHLLLWVAAGSPPVPENPFVCFSLGEMLNFPDAAPCPSPAL